TALAAVAMPVAAGFGIPLYVFGRYATRRLGQLSEPALAEAFLTSVAAATATALLAVAAALLVVHAARFAGRGAVALMTRFAALGYALPGTVLALGLLFSLAAIDNTVDSFAREWFGFS